MGLMWTWPFCNGGDVGDVFSVPACAALPRSTSPKPPVPLVAETPCDLAFPSSAPLSAATKSACRRLPNFAWIGRHLKDAPGHVASLQPISRGQTHHSKVVQVAGVWSCADVHHSMPVPSSVPPAAASQNSSLSAASPWARPQSPTIASRCSTPDAGCVP